MSRSAKQADDIAALIKARNGVLWVNSKEEQRAESWLISAAQSAGFMPFFWDCGQGVTDVGGRPAQDLEDVGVDAGACLDIIAERSRNGERELWVLRDLHKWIDTGPFIVRKLRNLARSLPPTGISIVVLAPGAAVPPELAGGDAVVVDWPLPDREELGKIIDRALEVAVRNHGDKIKPLNGERDAAIDAAVGLSGPQAESCIAKSIVQKRCIAPAVIADEKKRLIASNGMLQWIEPLAGGLEAIGGLDAVKGWLVQRELAFTPEAAAYGLPAPKGCLVVGLPGNGKSYLAQAISTTWRCPLIKGDLGASESKFLGESQKNIREMLSTVTAMGRVVLWFDEIDKTLSGGAGPAGDGGVAADKLATLLTWMNDRTNPCFIFATANDPDRLPVELLRKGRWDELWFVDIPTAQERHEVLRVTLQKFKRPVFERQDMAAIVAATNKFTSAEIATLVPEALFVSFADGKRELRPDDILAAASKVVPMVDSMSTQVNKLREWSKRARLATTPDAVRVVSGERALAL